MMRGGASLTASTPRALQVACFRVAGRDCAVDVMRIAEVLQPVPVTVLPAAPTFVEGIIELRGRFLPVIDLRRRFGGAPAGVSGRAKYIVAPIATTAVALVVDEVTGVERIPIDQIQPAPALGTGRVAPPFVSGIVHWNDRVLMLLDVDQILSAAEQGELAQIH
jgi:purine-binding chemotaxis protein CheW